MTRILHLDPDRRCKTVEEWPPDDRDLWQAALVPGDAVEDGGARAMHSEYSNRNAVYGYGRWLTWLDRQGLLDPTSVPADRITPARVKAYIADLERHAATQTLLNRVQELHAVAVVLDPGRDWRWVNRMYDQIRFRHRPARPKRSRLVPAGELFALGLTLMMAAENERTACARALVYRDGLLIALLARRPLRLRNLTSLVLDHTLVRRGTRWWIEFSAAETKGKEVIELPWPAALIEALETYLSRHRAVLAGFRRKSAPVNGALWLSKAGSPMSREAIYRCITMHTRNHFGRAINPHLFRDCVATTIAIDDPKHVGVASCLLGNAYATTEKYYNQARAIEASRAIQNVLHALRHGKMPDS
jgi:site-specific recombinase XerD